jgi:hypothetical protein
LRLRPEFPVPFSSEKQAAERVSDFRGHKAGLPFQGPANPGAQLRMAPPDLVKNRHWGRPGALFSKGTTSLSQTVASGSRRRRLRGAFFCDGSRRSYSMR